MNIYGEKIILRGIETTDNELLFDLVNDPDTEKMLGGTSWPVSKSEQFKWFERQESRPDILRCIVAVKETSNPVGTIILSDIDSKNGTAQIHIKMAKASGRGKGYGTDAVTTIVNYAFNELRLNCIYAKVLSYNSISIRLFEKCGFQKDGVLRARIYKGGNFVDVIEYSILRND